MTLDLNGRLSVDFGVLASSVTESNFSRKKNWKKLSSLSQF